MILFARQPVAGQAKTRLALGIGHAAAAALYEALLRDCVAATVEAARVRGPGASVSLAVTPDSSLAWFRDAFPGLPCAHQQGDDLGARMAGSLQSAWLEGAACAVVFGSDSPTVPLAARLETLDALRETPVVLAPDLGGGYYALGACRGVRLDWLDGIRWGGATVLSQTRTSLELAGLEHAETTPWHDVDVPEDLEELRRCLADGRGYRALHTLAALGLA